MQLAIHQQAVSVLPSMPRLKMANSGKRISRFSSRCFRRFSSQTSGSLTYLRTQMTRQRRQDADPQHAAPADVAVRTDRRSALDSGKPSPHEPCRTPLMKPRERTGQDSIASDAPAGHSAPMPMPRRARKKNRKAKFGENRR